MRGDAAVTLRLVFRATGMAGLAAAIGGLAAAVAAALPWHEVVATVDMLGAVSSRTEARAAGLPGWWWGWSSAFAGAVAMWLGALIALDRPVRWARAGLYATAGVLTVGAVVALLAPPAVGQIVDTGATLARTADQLPDGVELELAIRASAGPWVALVAAALVVVGAAGSREG